MAGFKDDTWEMPVEDKDADLEDSSVTEDDDLAEFDDTDEDTDYRPGIDPSLDSVEIDVEAILLEIAAEANSGDKSNSRIRKLLEARMERKRRHEAMMDFDEYDIED